MITVQSTEVELSGVYVKDVYNALFDLEEVLKGVELISNVKKKGLDTYIVEIRFRRFGFKKVVRFDMVVIGIPYWQVAYLSIGSADLSITIQLKNMGTGTRLSIESNVKNSDLGRKLAAKLAEDLVSSIKIYIENRFVVKETIPIRSLIEHIAADMINDKSRMFADIASSARLMMTMNLVSERKLWINPGDLLPVVLKHVSDLNGMAGSGHIYTIVSFIDGPRFKFLIRNGKIEAAACEHGEKLALGLSALEEASRADGEAVILQYKSMRLSDLKTVVL